MERSPIRLATLIVSVVLVGAGFIAAFAFGVLDVTPEEIVATGKRSTRALMSIFWVTFAVVLPLIWLFILFDAAPLYTQADQPTLLRLRQAAVGSGLQVVPGARHHANAGRHPLRDTGRHQHHRHIPGECASASRAKLGRVWLCA